jgi:sporulation protein YtfJ
MKTAMESIKDMVDVNTILGDPVETIDGSVIIPVSRVSFGFAAGGSEFAGTQKKERKGFEEIDKGNLPFGGGSGAGITLNPVAFLVVGKEQTRLLPIDGNILVDRIVDVAPQIIDKVQNFVAKGEKKEEQAEVPVY